MAAHPLLCGRGYSEAIEGLLLMGTLKAGGTVMDDESALVPAVAKHLGLGEIEDRWRGVDAVLPLLDRMREDGAVVIIKLDGERAGRKNSGQYTMLVSGKPLNGDLVRADTVTLEEGLARVIVEYARKCWQF